MSMAMSSDKVAAKFVHRIHLLMRLPFMNNSKYQSKRLTLYEPLSLALLQFSKNFPIGNKYQIIHKSLGIGALSISNTPADRNHYAHLLSLFVRVQAVLWRANIIIVIYDMTIEGLNLIERFRRLLFEYRF
jgi:hypothetical protein